MEIKTGTFNFPPGTGERTARLSFVFTHPITEAHVAMSGYRAEYLKSDRQIQRLVVRLSTEIGGRVEDGWVATVLARFNLRDENEEHAFLGSIDFVLFAEIEEFALDSTTSTAFALGGSEGLDPHVQKSGEEDTEAAADTKVLALAAPAADAEPESEEGEEPVIEEHIRADEEGAEESETPTGADDDPVTNDAEAEVHDERAGNEDAVFRSDKTAEPELQTAESSPGPTPSPESEEGD